MAWRYHAQRVLTGEWVDRDLLLQDTEITWNLTAASTLTAKVDQELARATDSSGRLVLDEWSTAIFAETESGELRFGGILTSSDVADGGSRQIECTSFSGYPHGRIYEGLLQNPPGRAIYFVKDVFEIVRYLWSEVQAPSDANVGVTLSQNFAGYPIGGGAPEIAEVPEGWPAITSADALPRLPDETANEYLARQAAWNALFLAKYELAWWNTTDMGDEIDNLLEQALADYIEQWSWNDPEKLNAIKHIELIYPRAGRRRPDLRFVEGENITVPPAFKRDGDQYANWLLALGAGEERNMLRQLSVAADYPRLRRDKVIAYKDALIPSRLERLANIELHYASDLTYFDSFSAVDHPHAPMGTWNLGDEIRIQSHSSWEELDQWVRITGWKYAPDKGDVAEITVTRLAV